MSSLLSSLLLYYRNAHVTRARGQIAKDICAIKMLMSMEIRNCVL